MTSVDYLAILIRHPEAGETDLRLNFVMPDVGEEFAIGVKNGVMNYTLGVQDPEAQATVTLDRSVLDAVNLGETTLTDAIANQDVTISGDQARVIEFLALLDTFEFWFNIVTP